MGGKQRRRRRRRRRRPSSPSIKSRTMDTQLLSRFMEVTSCESQENAVHCLGSCDWNLDEAINLYFSNAAGGSTEPPPSGSSTDPILIEEDVPPTEEDKYHGVAIIDGDYDDDVGAPSYHAVVEAPPCPALSEIVPTGWGEEEAEPGGAREAGAGNVDGAIQEAQDTAAAAEEDAAAAAAAGEDDNISTKGDDGGGMHSSNREEEEYGAYNSDEDYDNTSYEYDDDDGGYYDSTVEEADEGGRPAVQPRPQKESLDELFRPPYELMYHGSFHNAKVEAAREDRFLLVNLQASSGGAGDFPLQMQNRDLWADELVKTVVQDSFVFFLLQTEHSYAHLDECKKLASFYRLDDDQLPAVLVLDPITGQLLAKRSGGTVTPDEFVQFVDEYTKSNPSALSLPKFVAAKTPPPPVFPASGWGEGGEEELAWASDAAAPADDEAGEQEQEIPMDSAAAGGGDCSEQEPVPVPNNNTTDELPAEMVDDDDDEPKEEEEMYKLRIRFPDGKMVAKEFGCKRVVAMLYAFCRSAIHGGGQHSEEKAFRIMRFAGGALEAIPDDDAGATFEDLGLNFAAVSVVFDV